MAPEISSGGEVPPSSNPIPPALAGGRVEDLSKICGTLSQPIRLRILLILMTAGPQNVDTLRGFLKLNQPTISHHLGILRRAKLVLREPKGKYRFYRLDCETLSPLLEEFFLSLGSNQLQFDGFALKLQRPKGR